MEAMKVVDPDEDESQVRELFKFINEYFQLEEKMSEIQRYASEHPLLALVVFVTIGMCSVPCLMFLIFVGTSFTVIMVGFLCVEGTVLFIGALVLMGVLCFVIVMSLGFCLFLICCYYTVLKLTQVYQQLSGNISSFLGQTDDPLKKE